MIKNMKLHLLLSALIVSLCSQPALTAASVTIPLPDQAQVTRPFKKFLAKLSAYAKVPVKDAVFLWQWGVKKLHGQPITAQESERAQHILKISGITTAAIVTTIAGGTTIKFAVTKIQEQRRKEKESQEVINRTINMVAYANIMMAESSGDMIDFDWLKKAINRDPTFFEKSYTIKGANILMMLLALKNKKNEKNILELFEIAAARNTDLKTAHTIDNSPTTYFEFAYDQECYEIATFLVPYSDINDKTKNSLNYRHTRNPDDAALTALWNKVPKEKSAKSYN